MGCREKLPDPSTMYNLNLARALLNHLRGPRNGIQQGESKTFICKAFKGEVIVNYTSALITQQMKASGSPIG
jgi:hypothetical protein